MRTMSIIFSALWMFSFPGCSLANPVERMAQQISQSELTAYEMIWEDQEAEIRTIISGTEQNILDRIHESARSFKSRGGNPMEYIWMAPYGILTLTTSEGVRLEIGITSEGFAAFKSSSKAAYFTSKQLKDIVEGWIESYPERGRLIMSGDIMQNLADMPDWNLSGREEQ